MEKVNASTFSGANQISLNPSLDYLIEEVCQSEDISNRLCTYDGIKLRVHDQRYIEFILSDEMKEKFKFKAQYDENLKSVLSYSGEFKNFLIKIHYTPKGFVADLSGSIHKWANEGKHNYDQFHYLRFLIALKELCDTFYINISETHVVNLEVGINLALPPTFKLSVKEIIKQVLSIAGKGKSTRRVEEKQRESFFSRKGEKYYKMYDKGLHCNIINGSILRMELGYSTRRAVQKDAEVSFLVDLLKTEVQENFNKLLIKAFSTLHTTQPEMTELPIDVIQSNRQVTKYSSRSFWFDLKKRDRRLYAKHRKIQDELHNKYNGYNLRENLLKLLQDKLS